MATLPTLRSADKKFVNPRGSASPPPNETEAGSPTAVIKVLRVHSECLMAPDDIGT